MTTNVDTIALWTSVELASSSLEGWRSQSFEWVRREYKERYATYFQLALRTDTTPVFDKTAGASKVVKSLTSMVAVSNSRVISSKRIAHLDSPCNEDSFKPQHGIHTRVLQKDPIFRRSFFPRKFHFSSSTQDWKLSFLPSEQDPGEKSWIQLEGTKI